MKRHPSLEALSRDHNVGLIFGRRLVQASSLDAGSRKSAASELLQYWSDELVDHFAEEERLLTPLIASAESRERLVREHLEFTAIIDRLSEHRGDPDLVRHAGELLADHIHWEERVLFPEIERTVSPSRLYELAKQTELLEQRRADSNWSPRRAELVRRRAAMKIPAEDCDALDRRAIQRWETEGGHLEAGYRSIGPQEPTMGASQSSPEGCRCRLGHRKTIT